MDDDDMEVLNDTIRSKKVDSMVDEIVDIDYEKEAELGVDNHFNDQFSHSFYVPEIDEVDSMKAYKSNSPDGDEKEQQQHSDVDTTKGAIFKRSKILKDLDFLKDKQRIHVGERRREKWLEQLEKDTKFLTSTLFFLWVNAFVWLWFYIALRVMDYSYILGIHYEEREDVKEGAMDRWKEGRLFDYDDGGMSYCDEDGDGKEDEHEGGLEQSWSDDNGMKEQGVNCIYFGGIIDILQPYNARKKVENFMLGFKTDKTKVSSVDPEAYSKRLLEFMSKAVY